MIALTCSEAEEGRDRWTLQMLADKLVELHLVESIARETIRQVLNKNELKPWLKEQWCIPPKSHGEFVTHMEDVLEVYTRPYDERYPQVGVDEMSRQLISETRVPLPMQPGQPACYDYEYERQGTCNLFVACEPRASQAVSESDRASHQRGLCALSSGLGRCLLSQRREDHFGHG